MPVEVVEHFTSSGVMEWAFYYVSFIPPIFNPSISLSIRCRVFNLCLTNSPHAATSSRWPPRPGIQTPGSVSNVSNCTTALPCMATASHHLFLRPLVNPLSMISTRWNYNFTNHGSVNVRSNTHFNCMDHRNPSGNGRSSVITRLDLTHRLHFGTNCLRSG
jgi:hypothetical protein